MYCLNLPTNARIFTTMTKPAQLFALTAGEALRVAPEAFGVYTLYDADFKVVYMGKAEKQTLRDRIAAHADSSDECLAAARYFSAEVVKNPERVYRKCIKEFRAVHGALPECHLKLEAKAVSSLHKLSPRKVLTTAFV
jgi:hypothetical protein